jgi:hypothetical protein
MLIKPYHRPCFRVTETRKQTKSCATKHATGNQNSSIKQHSSTQNQGDQNAITHTSIRRSFQCPAVSTLVGLGLADLLLAIRSMRVVSTVGSWGVHGLRDGRVLGLGCWCVCRLGLLLVVIVIIAVRPGAEFASLSAHGHRIAEAEEGALLLLATLEHEVAAL